MLAQFNDPDDPLKIIIVTAKLLTGFDAPILQCQSLDKPVKEHTLLQAITRTNRRYTNPKTGQEVPITPRRVLSFRPSHLMKDRVAAGNKG